MEKKTFVYTQFNKQGYHRFPEADQLPQFATGDKYDVSHLALRHMHYFFFKVWVEVKHENRDIEFIQLRRWLEELYAGELDIDYMSCEMLSDNLAIKIRERWPTSEIRIDVSEENINGSYTEYPVGCPITFHKH